MPYQKQLLYPLEGSEVGRSSGDRRARIAVTALLAAMLANGNFMPELTTILAGMAAFMLAGAAPLKRSLGLCLPLVVASLIGALITIVWGVFAWDALRATYIYVRVPLHLALGIAIIVRFQDLRILMNAIILAAAGLAVYFLFRYFTMSDQASESRYLLRLATAGGWNILPFAIGIAIYLMRVWVNRPLIVTQSVLIVVGLSVLTIILSQSRTAAVGAIVIVAFLFGMAPVRGYARIWTPLIILALFLLTTPALNFFLPIDVIGLIDESAPASVRELLAIDRLDQAGVNDYWRGYETFTAFHYVESRGPEAIAFGTGLHSLVPLRNLQLLQGEQSFGEIPVFHNLFSFALVRGGLVGIGLVGLFYTILAIPLQALAESPKRTIRLFGRLACGVHFSSILAIPATTGLLNATELAASTLVLIGAAIAVWDIERRNDVMRQNGPLFASYPL